MKRLSGIEDFLHHFSHLVDLDRENTAIFAFVAGGLNGIRKGLIDGTDPVAQEIVETDQQGEVKAALLGPGGDFG